MYKFTKIFLAGLLTLALSTFSGGIFTGTALAGSSASSLSDSELRDFFHVGEGTTWEYRSLIDYNLKYEEDVEDRVVDTEGMSDDEVSDTIGETVIEYSCQYTNCYSYGYEDSGYSMTYAIENGEVILVEINGQRLTDQPTAMDKDGYSDNDASWYFDVLVSGFLGIDYDNMDAYDVSVDCEVDVYEDVFADYTADALENFCAFEVTNAYTSNPKAVIYGSEIYMDGLGFVGSEVHVYYYEDDEKTWAYTLYSLLVDTSVKGVNADDQWDQIAAGTYDEEDDSGVKGIANDVDDLTDALEDATVGAADDGDGEVVLTEDSDDAGSGSDRLFDDLSPSHRNYDAIVGLYDEGVIQGYDDGSFKPSQTVNRAELLKILVEGQGVTPDAETYSECFPDLEVGAWYEKYVCYAEAEGWVQGYPDGNFRPGDTVNKVEALKMLLNSQMVESEQPDSAPFEDVSLNDWFAEYVSTAKGLGILEELGEIFEPDGDMTRAGICENLWRLLSI